MCVCCISMLCPFIRVCVGVCWRVLVCVSVNVFLWGGGGRRTCYGLKRVFKTVVR